MAIISSHQKKINDKKSQQGQRSLRLNPLSFKKIHQEHRLTHKEWQYYDSFIVSRNNGKRRGHNDHDTDNEHQHSGLDKPDQKCTNRSSDDATNDESENRLPSLHTHDQKKYSCADKGNKKFGCIHCANS